MVVERVGPAAGKQSFRRVELWVTVALVMPTVGGIVLLPFQVVHRSVDSFVVTLLWTLAALILSFLMIAGPDAEPDGEGATGAAL